MPGKPVSLPTWDSTLTNLIPPTAGHQTSGYAVNEVPTSTELNGELNLLGQWAAFLSNFMANAGSAQGNADLGNTVESSLIPVFANRDYLQNLRSLVDHNGYRMGQVSELDEPWNAAPVTIVLPMEAGAPLVNPQNWTYQGPPSFWQYSNASGVTSGELTISLQGVVPQGALITGLILECNRLNTSDTAGVAITTTAVNAASRTTIVSKTILTGTAAGNANIDLSAAPATGHLPFQMPSVTALDNVAISLQCTDTAASTIKFFGVRVTYISPPPGWTAIGNTTNIVAGSTSGDQFAAVDPQSGLNQRGMQLLSTANAGAAAGLLALTSNFETYLDTSTVYVEEFMLKTGVITDGSAARVFFAGIKGSGGVFVGLYNDATLPNWQVRIGVTNTNTTSVVVAATAYRVRIEIYGTTMNSSGTPKIRLYINGAKVAEVNTALAADKFQPFFSAGTSGTAGGPYDFTVGRLRRAWNHLASGDNL